MFTPGELERMPKALEKLYSELEWRIMQDIIRRLKINGEITRSADWQLYRYYELGESKKVIKQAVKDALDLSDHEVNRLYSDAIASGYARDKALYMAAGKEFVPYAENFVLQQMVSAIKEQTLGELKNITQSLGFAKNVNGKLQFTELAGFYQKTLDAAMLDITSGAFDYNTVLRRTIEAMTNSGLRTVDYASGWSNRVEVAARRALMTGITQIAGKINEQNAEELGTEHFEISWHADARPTHQVWQGRVYSKEELKTVCGLGTGDGLAGWNCRHSYFPFIPGISVRAYTDEELDRLNAKENLPKEWNGKQYTSYEASQKQRRMETTMRAQRQKIKLLKEGGASKEELMAAKSRYRKTMNDYVEFSEAMGIPQQRERLYTGKPGKEEAGAALLSGQGNMKLKDTGADAKIVNNGTKEAPDLHLVGKIDKKIYRCVTEDIVTDDVIITNERIQHIKERHPNDYERFYKFLEEVVKYPDYIVETNKPNTALVLKEMKSETGEQFKTVLRLLTSTDNPEFKNSIITFMKINEKEWNRLLKNKRILYKKE